MHGYLSKKEQQVQLLYFALRLHHIMPGGQKKVDNK